MAPSPARIEKYHGTGNDFVVVDAATWSLEEVARFVGALCDRHRGVGADGVLHVERRPDRLAAGLDAYMTVINRDGSRPQMCGNGVRCVARYLVEQHGLATELVIGSDAGPRACRFFVDDESVEVDMGVVRSDGDVECEAAGRRWSFRAVDVGNPHAVVFEPVTDALADAVGAELNAPGSPFAEGVNVEFVVAGDGRLDVVVYERGVGRTQACGTGACAVAFAAWDAGIAGGDEVVVGLPGGDLRIRREGGRIWMRGDAEHVFSGSVSATWMAR